MRPGTPQPSSSTKLNSSWKVSHSPDAAEAAPATPTVGMANAASTAAMIAVKRSRDMIPTSVARCMERSWLGRDAGSSRAAFRCGRPRFLLGVSAVSRRTRVRYLCGNAGVDVHSPALNSRHVAIAVLGPLACDVDTSFGRRDRAVLTALAICLGRVVSPDQLTDAVWGETPPATAHKALQGCVLRLRKALGVDAIETSPGAIGSSSRQTRWTSGDSSGWCRRPTSCWPSKSPSVRSTCSPRRWSSGAGGPSRRWRTGSWPSSRPGGSTS